MATFPHLPAALLLLFLFPIIAVSQSPPPSRNYDDYNNSFGTTKFSSSTAIVIVALLSAFFFLAFFSIYIRQCSLGRSSNIGVPVRVFAEGGRRTRGRGLDTALLETFPTFAYSEVKELKLGKEVLECAVCLSDFSDHENLRLLPACNHVFHPECIDVWLGSHVTCPICRTNLAATPVESNNTGEADNTLEDQVAITVAEDEQTPRRIFGRSHTTGHSVSLPTSAGCDRHTLRLPEHVRKEILAARKFRRATSCVGFEGGGEASGRRGYRSMGGRSERWGTAFFARAMSMRVPAWAAGRRGEGEESMTKGEGSFKSRRFDCLGGGAGGERDDDESSTAPFARV